MKNNIKNMVLETIEGLYKTDSLDDSTLKEVRVLVPVDEKD